MAEDFYVVPEPLDFHVLNIPHGMQEYRLDDLTKDQQMKLIDLRVQTIRDDEKYLAKHPEIRAIVFLIIRHLFVTKPRRNISTHVAKFVHTPNFKHEVNKYLSKWKGHKFEEAPPDTSGFEKPRESSFDMASNIVKKVIRELYKTAVDRVEYKRQESQFIAEDIAKCAISVIQSKVERLMHPSLVTLVDNSEFKCQSQLNILSQKYVRQYEEDQLYSRNIVREVIDRCLDAVCGEEVNDEASEEYNEEMYEELEPYY